MMKFRYLVWPDTQKVKYKVELQQAEEGQIWQLWLHKYHF